MSIARAFVSTDDALRHILASVDVVRQSNDRSWECRCPTHDDNRPSMTVTQFAPGGSIYLNCHVGCPTEGIVAHLGMEMKDLFPPRPKSNHEPTGTIVATYDYCNADGSLAFQVVRFEPKDFRQRRPRDASQGGGGGWNWSVKGCPVIPYRLPELAAADPARSVLIVEGEKDADRLAGLGLIATCNAGGASVKSAKNPRPRCKWTKQHSEFLRGRHVVILPDNDQAGRDHAAGIAKALHGLAATIRVVDLPGLSAKGDVSDWLEAGGTRDELAELVGQAAEWVQPAEPDAPNAQQPGRHAPWEGYKLTDMGNAERFARDHGANVRYCFVWNSWLTWDGTRWAMDSMGNVQRMAKKTVRDIYLESANEKLTSEEAKEVSKWAHASEKSSSLRAMIATAQSEEPIPISADSLDAEPWLLNCENGTVDLFTGQLRPHQQSDYLTKRCPVEYPTEAGDDPVLWLNFLDRIFDGNAELIGFIQRLMGLSLVGETIEQILPIFYGTGSNGKSVLIETWCGLLGKGYAMKAPQGFLMVKHGESHPTGLADLHGKRIVAAVETSEDGRLSEALIKELTGDDSIRARRMREDFWEFRPSHTPVIATNHKPTIRGTDYAIWRRLRLIPFTVTISSKEKDKRLRHKLRAEWPAILKWAVAGCLQWQKNGLQEPSEVLIATNEYRSDQDTIGNFIEECCLVGPQYKIQSSILYAKYKKWIENRGEHPFSQKKFSTKIVDRGFKKEKSGGVVWCEGLTDKEIDTSEYDKSNSEYQVGGAF